MEEFPSGQRGQTVNLLSVISMVRIHLPPPKKDTERYLFLFRIENVKFKMNEKTPKEFSINIFKEIPLEFQQ